MTYKIPGSVSSYRPYDAIDGVDIYVIMLHKGLLATLFVWSEGTVTFYNGVTKI